MHTLMARKVEKKAVEGDRQHVIFEGGAGGTWSARLASDSHVAVTGASFAQARKRMREALGDARARRSPVGIREEIRLPGPGNDAVRRLAQARQALEAAEREAVVTLVRRLGLAVREASASLGISMRKVVHYAGEVADDEAARKTARRAAAR